MEELDRSRADDFAARRTLLRDIFHETLEAVDVRRIFSKAVSIENGSLRITDLRYDLSGFRRVLVIAIGKAAVPSADLVFGQLARANASAQAIVVGPGEIAKNTCPIKYWSGSHPLPDATAREAAHEIINRLQQTDHRDLVLFLISGGASAMVELPLDPSITVEETAEFYQALVHSGLNITQMNTLRKHVSAVKGGRLAQLAPDAAKCTLLISDVPDASIDVVGSGPTLPDSSTREHCWALLRNPQFHFQLPSRTRALLESADLPETPKHDAACFRHAEARVLLSTETMLAAAADSCRRLGFHVHIDNTCDDWEYRAAAEYLLAKLRSLAPQHPRVALLSGGEVLVKLGDQAGSGGRNQQFALYCATQLDSIEADVSVLSVGTDGIDGNSPAAGAVIDRTTQERARQAGFHVNGALHEFNAYPLFAAIGDAIVTGATGNNIRDLRILTAERSG